MAAAQADAARYEEMLPNDSDAPNWLRVNAIAHTLEGTLRREFERTGDPRLPSLLERLGSIVSEISEHVERADGTPRGFPSYVESIANFIAGNADLRAKAAELVDLSDLSVDGFRASWAYNRFCAAEVDRVTLTIPSRAQLREALAIFRNEATDAE